MEGTAKAAATGGLGSFYMSVLSCLQFLPGKWEVEETDPGVPVCFAMGGVGGGQLNKRARVAAEEKRNQLPLKCYLVMVVESRVSTVPSTMPNDNVGEFSRQPRGDSLPSW